MDQLRITESSASLRFAPLYVADRLGFFRDADLEMIFGIDAGPGGSWLPENLVNDKADIALGGIWLPLLYRQRGIAPLVTIGAIAHRNAALLLGRAPQEAPLEVEAFKDRRILMSLAAASQWMFWEGVLREKGADPSQLRIVRDLDVATTRSLWEHGYADYFLVEPVLGEILLERGAHIAATMSAFGGPVPWSACYADAHLIERRPEAFARFIKAIRRALDCLLAGDLRADRVLADLFPKVGDKHRRSVLSRFAADSVWMATTKLDPAATERYEDMMVRYGLLDPIPANGPRPSAEDIATTHRLGG